MSTALPIAVGDVFHDWTVVEIVPWKGRRWLRMRCVCGKRRLALPTNFRDSQSCATCARAKLQHRALPVKAA
jgi:hypothetical protein